MTNKIRVISIILAVFIAATGCIYAIDSNIKIRDTEIYWIRNAELLETYLGFHYDSETNNNVSDKIVIGNYDKKTNSVPAEYYLNIGGNKIVLKGRLAKEYVGGNNCFSGNLENIAVYNNREFLISGIVNTIDGISWMNTGITISPIDAKSLDEMVFMGIGDPLSISEGKNESNKDEFESFATSESNNTNSAYAFKGLKNIFSSNIIGYAEKFQVWYSQDYERACVAAYSNTTGVESYFAGPDDVPVAYVNSVKIGLKPTNEGAHIITGLYDFPNNTSTTAVSNTNVFSEQFISSVPNATTSWYATQNNSYVDFQFNQSVWNNRYIKFDDAPISVKFGVGAAHTGTYSFTGYSSMSYFVLIAHPEINSSTVINITVPEGTIEIPTIFIDTTD